MEYIASDFATDRTVVFLTRRELDALQMLARQMPAAKECTLAASQSDLMNEAFWCIQQVAVCLARDEEGIMLKRLGWKLEKIQEGESNATATR